MKFTIPVKPLSVNQAWKGRKFKTMDHKIYERDVAYFLPHDIETLKGELEVKYTFYLKNYKMSDAANFEKILSDILVSNRIMEDDRYIKRIICQKEPVTRSEDERIDIEIRPF